MKFIEVIELIKSDLSRYDKINFKNFLRYVYFTPGFIYTYHMRIFKYLSEKPIIRLLKPLFVLRLKHYTYKYGIQIPLETNIGKGILIRHFGGIFINPRCVIGDNFIISQGVTLGLNNVMFPIIGKNVFIAPGAKVIGNVKMGNNVTIGVNSVVIDNIPDNCVVAGNPAKILYYKNNINL